MKGKKLTYSELLEQNKKLKEELNQYKKFAEYHIDNSQKIQFEDLFNIDEIQKIQDSFAKATGVASLITDPKGKPITKPSNFCSLCSEIIRSTEAGVENCKISDAAIGKYKDDGPTIQPCLSAGLMDAGASISVGDKHIANWLIGQVKNESTDKNRILKYIKEIGADETEFEKAFDEVTVMSTEQFKNVASSLFLFANEISSKAFHNFKQKQLIEELQEKEKQLVNEKTKVEKNEAHLNTLINTIPDLIWLKDINGVYLDCNKRFEQFFGATKDEILGKTDYDFVDKELADFFRVHDKKAMMAGKPTMNEEEITFASDGHKEYLETIKTPVLSKNDKIKGVLGIGRNISRRKRYEEQLLKAKEKSEESDRLKTAFLQNLSHEIRTPLNAICGFVGMLDKPRITEPKRHNFVSIIKKSSDQLLSIVTDILTISALQTKQEKLNIGLFCVNDILDDLLTIFNQQHSNSEVIITNKKGLNEEQSLIYGDRTKITQILTNLVSNSLKFTTKGVIEFGYTVENNYLKFYNKDTGKGIPFEYQDKIFERFRQVDITLDKKHGGTGLGLSISKGFVELWSGEIWVESTPGKGTTFFFTVPFNKNKPESNK